MQAPSLQVNWSCEHVGFGQSDSSLGGWIMKAKVQKNKTKLPLVLTVDGTIAPQWSLNATGIARPLVWGFANTSITVFSWLCLDLLQSFVQQGVIFFLFIANDVALSCFPSSVDTWRPQEIPIPQLDTPTECSPGAQSERPLPSQPSSSSPPPLTSVIGQSSTPSQTCDLSKHVCLSEQRNAGAEQSIGRGQSRSSHASGSVATFGT